MKHQTDLRESKVMIVGQGLAGTMLSYSLHQRRIDHFVIDDPKEGSATRAAAGLINPVVVKRVVKTWQADLFLPFAIKQYRNLETLLNQRFFYPVVMKKIFGLADRAFWASQIVKEGLEADVTIPNQPDILPGIMAPNGYSQIKSSARLDMSLLINRYRHFLMEKNRLLESDFNDEDLVFENGKVRWRDIVADKIIFCRGAWDEKSRFFEQLKFRSTKGELFDAQIQGLDSNSIINKAVFVMPIGGNRFKVGATYSHHWEDLLATSEKRAELLEKWSNFSSLPICIDRQICGIRPTMHDRRPVMGFLTKVPQIGIFNGMGSRGGLMAPWLAHQMVDLIYNPEAFLNEEVDVIRYES